MGNQSERLGQAHEVLLRLGGGEYTARTNPSAARDDIDALLTSINMLAETLEHERRCRREAEKLLEDEREAYERSPGLFASVDVAGRVLTCNLSFANQVGLTKQQVIGRSLFEFHRSADRPRLSAFLEATAADQRATLELTLDFNKAPRIVLLAASRAIGPGGQTERFRLLYRDVTDERRLERDLREAQKMEAIGRIAGGIAHDFNNFLTVIQSTVAVLLSEELSEEHRQDLDDVSLAAKRASDLTHELLVFAGHRFGEPKVVDVVQVLKGMEGILRKAVGGGCEVCITPSADTPPVCIDPLKLEQIVMNLGINARDAMPNGGTIDIATGVIHLDHAAARSHQGLEPGWYVYLSVRDEGLGVPPDILDRIFEPFFTTKPKGQGTGLGLAICYGIVRHAEGAITCRSEAGRGTVFEIFLPPAREGA